MAKRTSKVVEVAWEACEHEGGEYLDHCMRCAPFWKRFPVAVNAADVGRVVYVVNDVAYATLPAAKAECAVANMGGRNLVVPRKVALRAAPKNEVES